jgi:hypothetical protein
MLSKADKQTARRLAAEWARRYYADAVADSGRVADAEKSIRNDVASQEDSASQFLVASKGEFSHEVDRDELWRLYWPKATEALKKRLAGGVGSPRRNPEEQRMVAPVPRRGRASGSDGLEGSLNINTATAAQFRLLPGIGPRVASEIVDLRRRMGGQFASPSVLRDQIDGIGPRVFSRIEPHLALRGETSLSRRLRAPKEESAPLAPTVGSTLRVRFETDLGITLKEVEVRCASPKPRDLDRCARETITKHVTEPSLRDVTLAVAYNVANGLVILSLKVSHCTDCEADGKPRLKDVKKVLVERAAEGFRITSLFDSEGRDVSKDFRSLTVWAAMPDRSSVESMAQAVFPAARVDFA